MDNHILQLDDAVTREPVSRFFSDDAHRAATEPKELYDGPGAGHADLYDNTDLIPFDKFEASFTEHLEAVVSRPRRRAHRLRSVTPAGGAGPTCAAPDRPPCPNPTARQAAIS